MGLMDILRELVLTKFGITPANFVVLLLIAALLGGLAGAIMFNRWFKRAMAWRIGWGKKGFLFLMDNGHEVGVYDFDPKEGTWKLGEFREYTIDPNHIWRWMGIPVVYVNVNHTSSISMDRSKGDALLDPQEMHAIVQLQQRIASIIASKQNKGWRDLALIAAALSPVIVAVAAWVLYDQGKVILAFAQQAAQEALKVATKIG